MSLKCGIVGLPNVGKSTIFNAMTKTQAAEAANYPFCTIEPNIAKVSAYDARLESIAKIANTTKLIYTQLDIVDIAGLVKGASKGEGLGNKFLANIREVDLIIHVLRCFEDKDIRHVNDKIDPIEDLETIEIELKLADIQTIENKIKKEKGNKPIIKALEKMLIKLQSDQLPEKEEYTILQEECGLHLLTSKPVLYACNVDDQSIKNGNFYSKKVENFAKDCGRQVAIVSAAIEQEISGIEDKEERKEFLAELGTDTDGLGKIVAKAAKLLNTITFFTAGEKEAKAWQIKNGSTAPKAAGVIHTDFEKKFIKAEVISFKDYIENLGEKSCKALGKLRLEGRDYIVKDGDIMHFKHG